MLNRATTRKEFISTAQNSGCELDQATEKLVTELSEHNFERLQTLSDNLLKMGKLNSQTFTLALERVTASIPVVPISTKSKTRLPNGSMHKLGDSTSFFLKKRASHQEDAHGGQSKVSIGYSSADAKAQSVSVKRICLPEDEYLVTKQSIAIRETKNLRLLGRHAEWYQNKKGPVIVTEWQHGNELEETKQDLSTFSYARRFAWLACGLAELNILHKKFRLHGDIKPGNFILDTARDQLKLIDFGTTQKVNSNKDFVCTAMYVDMKEGKPKKLSSDMFAMGYVVAYVFPELFTLMAEAQQGINIQNGRITFVSRIIPPILAEKKKNANLSTAEKAIYALIDAMMEATAEDRCTSDQALQCCITLANLMKGGAGLSEIDLTETLIKTINRNTYEVEDALRGSQRPAKFGAIADVRPAAVAVKLVVAARPETEIAKPVVGRNNPEKATTPTLFNQGRVPPVTKDTKDNQDRHERGCTLM